MVHSPSAHTHRAADGTVVADPASLTPCPFCKTKVRMGYDPKTEMYGPEGDHLPGCIIGNWDLREYAYRADATAAWNARGSAEPSNNACQFDVAQPVSNPYKFVAEIAWLRKAARYFSKRPTGGEDSAHWANVYNAENATKLADRLAALGMASTGDSVGTQPLLSGEVNKEPPQ